MMSKDYEVFSKLLSYNPKTGQLTWEVRQGQCAPKHPAGYPAGDLGLNGSRYLEVRYNYRAYKAHRLAWLLMTGEFPPSGMQIDHINGIRDDNRWENLRLVSKKQNALNRSTHKNNSVGERGVSFDKRGNKFRSRISKDGQTISLGSFATLEEAVAARKEAEAAHFAEYARG